jgi:uncharacterized membrane protein YjfL (UPF0719 family)
MSPDTIAQLKEIIWTIAWALVGSVAMGLSLGLLIKFFDWMTPVNEWNQIRNGNLAMGMILAAVILAFGLVVAFTLLPTNFSFNIVIDGTPHYLKALAGQVPK